MCKAHSRPREQLHAADVTCCGKHVTGRWLLVSRRSMLRFVGANNTLAKYIQGTWSLGLFLKKGFGHENGTQIKLLKLQALVSELLKTSLLEMF